MERFLQMEAPAKINLGLRVLRRREDGYHDIETVFLRIGWHDVVRVEERTGLSLEVNRPDIPSDERNLCLQAATRLRACVETSVGAHITLEKRIPSGAGLGGGSSDAAATLRLLQRLWSIKLSPTELHAIGRKLGADVPFFLLDERAAYATGRGDVLHPIPTYRFPFYLVVVKPSCSISTAEAYQNVRPRVNHGEPLHAIVSTNDPAYWRKALKNDFEDWAVRTYPEVQHVHTLLTHAGACYVSLSGSGSALFGVFEHEQEAQDTCVMFEEQGYVAWCGGAA